MKYCLIIAAFLFTSPLQTQTVYYVKSDAAGAGNGTSWSDAFIDLQEALGIAGYGDQIWVASGTYKPSTGFNRNIAFNIRPGIQLFGGFAGFETGLSQRNLQTNVATLDGDIGITGVHSDNAYHVVTIYGGDSLTILDGFTILNGRAGTSADPFPIEFGGGVLVVANTTNPLARPVIQYCRFEQNWANSGGAIACIAVDNSVTCAPEIRHCVFKRNRGQVFGGSIYKNGKNLPYKPFRLYNCVFEDNYCFQYAGGVAIINPSGTVQLHKCSFKRDSSRIESGAVYVQTGDYSVRYEIDSCNFTANFSLINSGGFSHINMGFDVDSIILLFHQSTFFLNKTFSGNGAGINSQLSGVVKKHSVSIEGSWFESNISHNGGSGIYINGGGSGTSIDVSVNRCYFLGNTVTSNPLAGAFYYSSTGGDKNRNTITNSVFVYNDGAIASLGGKPGTSDTRVANCTFYRNNEAPFIKYWDSDINGVTFYMNMQILNSIIWEPQTEGPHTLFYNNDPMNFNVRDFLVEHSLIHLSDCTYDGQNPCQDGMRYALWPNFFDSTGISFEVLNCSPGQNGGSNLVVDTFNLSQDYLGKARIAADTVDMGAYEVQGPCMSSGIEDGAGLKQSVYVTALGNPTSFEQGISVEIFTLLAGNYSLELFQETGQLILQEFISLPSLQPTLLRFQDGITPGLYFLTIRDDRGRSHSIKILVN